MKSFPVELYMHLHIFVTFLSISRYALKIISERNLEI